MAIDAATPPDPFVGGGCFLRLLLLLVVDDMMMMMMIDIHYKERGCVSVSRKKRCAAFKHQRSVFWKDFQES
jgi:hypothetical protein